MDSLDHLKAELDGLSLTGSDGESLPVNETQEEDAATSEEKTTEEESATVEKPEESTEEAPKDSGDDSENDDESQLAEDDSGKRYVPESRFKKVYGQMKEYERRVKEIESSKTTQERSSNEPSESRKTPERVDRTDMLEIEMLRTQMPEFDPSSDSYSRELDELGADIFTANPGISRIEAARRAKERASRITKAFARATSEARAEKSEQSDRGITTRVTSRAASEPDPDSMSLEEKEAYLKEHGAW